MQETKEKANEVTFDHSLYFHLSLFQYITLCRLFSLMENVMSICCQDEIANNQKE